MKNIRSTDSALNRSVSELIHNRYTGVESSKEISVSRLVEPQRRFSLLDGMYVERGTKKDWDRLAGFHYKAANLPLGPKYYRCVTADGDLVGITVLSSVSLLLGPRHDVFPKLKCGNDTRMTNTRRAKYLNTNFTRAARIVTDTLYRGVGASYRMVNLACRMEGMRFIEIQSSMSKFNPFDVKAGFKHAHLKSANAYVQGIRFLRGYFLAHPADHQEIMKEFYSFPPSVQKGVLADMRLFYFRWSTKEKTGKNYFTGAGHRKVQEMMPENMLREIQQLTFATPVYGIYENPDLGNELPERLPLGAFDRQGVNEPLIVLESDG
jgi:ABC-type ATPase with predicted acetyltransferase domain